MFEAVIFDWDATLADTQGVIAFSFQQALNAVDVKISDAYIERCIGMGAVESFRKILRETKHPVDECLVKQLVESKSQTQIGLKNQVSLFPDAMDLLESLQGKVKLGLASMNSKSVIDTLVKAKAVEKYFQAILTAEDVKYSKPHPEIFLKCAHQLNTSPSKCIVIEDSLFGVKAAKAAGMKCIAVTTGVYSKEEIEQETPDAIVANLAQVKVLLQNNQFF